MISTKEELKKQRFQIASLSASEIETYFNIKLAGTKKLAKVKRVLDSLTEKDLLRLASAMGDEYKTDFYWSNLEYHFDRIFIYGDSK